MAGGGPACEALRACGGPGVSMQGVQRAYQWESWYAACQKPPALTAKW
jgi:hypothetical protein